jgi:hypothetical protein
MSYQALTRCMSYGDHERARSMFLFQCIVFILLVLITSRVRGMRDENNGF